MDIQKLFFAMDDSERELLHRILVEWKRSVLDPSRAELDEHEIELVRCDRYIAAIKAARMRLGLPLKGAKEVVDRYRHPDHSHWLAKGAIQTVIEEQKHK